MLLNCHGPLTPDESLSCCSANAENLEKAQLLQVAGSSDSVPETCSQAGEALWHSKAVPCVLCNRFAQGLKSRLFLCVDRWIINVNYLKGKLGALPCGQEMEREKGRWSMKVVTTAAGLSPVPPPSLQLLLSLFPL